MIPCGRYTYFRAPAVARLADGITVGDAQTTTEREASQAISVFDNPEFGAIRTIDENGTVLFCGRDAAIALGYTKPQKAIADHCKGL